MRRLILPALILALLAGLLTAAPAQAATVGCNSNTSTGVVIHTEPPPPGSNITRYISAKVCGVYDTNSVRNATSVHCRTQTGAECSIRAEVLHAKLDQYDVQTLAYVKTWANDWLKASADGGYSANWSWYGTDVRGNSAGFPCVGYAFQANDFNIRVRWGYNGVLEDVGNAFSAKFNPSC